MRRYILLFLVVFLILTYSNNLYSQGLGGGFGDENRVEGKAKFLPIPYVNYDRSIGFSIGALPMLMFNPVAKDTLSPSSTVGALGMYTTNDTWFTMGFGKFHFNEDKWRLLTAGGYGSINFQFYIDNIIQGWIPYNTKVGFFLINPQHKILENLYGGISYIYLKFDTQLENAPTSFENTLNGIGLNLSFDKRNNVFYPRKGYLTSIKYFSFPEWFNNEYPSDKVELDYNHYFPIRKNKDVVAGRFFAGLGLGDLTFNQQFIVGQTDIRGYSQGEYRGNYLLALQGEYRWNFYKRWGAVGFAGVATLFEANNDNQNGKLLPGIGTGIRFTAQKDTQFKVGMDIAAGINDWAIYFRISEAF